MDPSKADIHRLAADSIRELFAKEPEQLSVSRLSVLLGQGSEATYRMLENCQIPATRLPNNRWLIYSSAVSKWLVSYHSDCAHEGATSNA